MAISKAVRSMVVDLERRTRVELSPVERLLMSTDGTVTHMLEALTRGRVTVDILDREVVGTTLYRTVALERAETGSRLAWARSEVNLDPLDGSLTDELVSGDIGIGDVLRETCAETRREIVDMEAVSRESSAFPPFVETDAACLLKRTYRIYSGDRRIMTITEYFPRGQLV